MALAPFLLRKRREADMALVKHSKKSCAVNPLKMSQPIGGALAFILDPGLDFDNGGIHVYRGRGDKRA